jgi:hypothetical protein
MATNWEKALGILEPLFSAPLVSGLNAIDEAKKREKALGGPPQYEIPESVDQYEEMMRTLSQGEVPGYGLMKEDIQERGAADMTGVSQLSSPEQALSGVREVSYDQMNQLSDLGMRAFEWRDQANLGYAGAMQNTAQQETMQYEYNEWLPWQIAKNEIASLRGAGQAAQQSGTDTMGAAGIQAVSMFSS